jgi:glycosyltransferase involved in cell wall biosynthesis
MANRQGPIALLNALYTPYLVGGAERSVRQLARALRELGREVVVISLKPSGAPEEELIDDIPVTRVPLRNLYWPYRLERPPFPVRALWQAADVYNPLMGRLVGEVLEHYRPSVVSAHNLPGFSVAAWSAARRLGIPVVHTLRDYSLLCSRGGMFRRGKACQGLCALCNKLAIPRRIASRRLVDHVVGVSRFTLEEHRSAGFFAGVAGSVVYNPAVWSPPREAPPPVAPGRRRLAFLGRIEPSKGIEQLLAAFAMVSRPAELAIYGEGNDAYLAQLKQRFANTAIKWMGVTSDTSAAYAAADVIVVPSVWGEPMTKIVMEAGAAGVPTICAASGGIPEAISFFANTQLYAPQDVAGLAALLEADLPPRAVPPVIPPELEPNYTATAYTKIFDQLQ